MDIYSLFSEEGRIRVGELMFVCVYHVALRSPVTTVQALRWADPPPKEYHYRTRSEAEQVTVFLSWNKKSMHQTYVITA
jgi:hypothetical protein